MRVTLYLRCCFLLVAVLSDVQSLSYHPDPDGGRCDVTWSDWSPCDQYRTAPCPGSDASSGCTLTERRTSEEMCTDNGICSSTKFEVACEGDELSMECPSGQKIKIANANFGRTKPDGVVCPFGKKHKDNTTCMSDTSKTTMKGLCQGEESCSVTVAGRLFGPDPCPGTYKYIQVGYQCCEEEVDPCAAGNPCNGGVCTKMGRSFTCNCTGSGYTGDTCDVEIPCSPQPLISGPKFNIPDDHLTASSQWTSTHNHRDVLAPENSRLDQCPTDAHRACAWTPKGNQIGQYIQADLGRKFKITKVAIQGRGATNNYGDGEQHVTRFSLAVSEDGVTFQDLDNNGSGYEGAHDQNTVVTNDIPPTVARYVRLIIMAYNIGAAVRWELYGCTAE